jgi:hypothetical protein
MATLVAGLPPDALPRINFYMQIFTINEAFATNKQQIVWYYSTNPPNGKMNSVNRR